MDLSDNKEKDGWKMPVDEGHILLDVFLCIVSLSIFYELCDILHKKTCKRDSLSNTPNCYFNAGEFREYLSTGST